MKVLHRAALLAPGLLLLVGCYTVLQHPVVQDGPTRQQVDQAFNCAACHDTGHESGNFRAPVVFHADIQRGGYAYFQDYPWWWAEPATLKYVIPDSSRALLPDSLAGQTTSGGYQVFQRLRSSQGGSSGGETGGLTTDSSDDKKKQEEKKKKPRVMKRKRR